MNDVARSLPRINVSLNHLHEDQHSSMVEIEVKKFQIIVSILIDLGSILSYISPIVAQRCRLIK